MHSIPDILPGFLGSVIGKWSVVGKPVFAQEVPTTGGKSSEIDLHFYLMSL